jgi:alkylation response protein AidB-like acyl-CoA dehydrogenase
MDFAFSEEQEMLRAGARQFLSKSFSAERVAELAQSDDGWDPSSWKQIAELGWTGLSVSEDDGGAGMGFLEEAVIFEETGYALYPGPYFSTVGLALPALNGEVLAKVVAGDAAVTFAWAEAGGPLTLDDLASCGTKAEGSGEDWTLSGDKFLVPDLNAVDHAVVVAQGSDGLGLFLMDVDQRPGVTVDTTRRLGTLSLNGTPAQLLVDAANAGTALESIRLRAYVALSLEAVGIAQRALELAQEHVKTREQFGKPIGVYQGVSHQVSNIYMDTELSRSLAYWAAWCVATGDENAPRAVLAAKAQAATSAVAACERSIQVHGGIGFTWEHILHRYYKRAEWIESFDGHPSIQRGALAAELLAD